MPFQTVRIAIRPIVAAMTGHSRRWSAACDTDRIGMTVFLSILGGNLAHLPYRRDGGTIAGLDVPDEARQPVSLLSVATAAALPYETARGRLPRLAASGLIRRGPAGLIVPAAVLAQPDMLAVQRADHEALAEAIGQLIAVGYPLPRGLTIPKVERLPTTLAARLAVDFQLRTIETLVSMHGSIINSTIIGAVISANIRDLMTDPGFARRYPDHDRPPPDHLRQPIPLRQLAREIAIPFETLRRRVQALIETGDVAVRDGGLIVPSAVLVQPRFEKNNLAIVRHFRRLLLDVVRLSR